MNYIALAPAKCYHIIACGMRGCLFLLSQHFSLGSPIRAVEWLQEAVLRAPTCKKGLN